MTNISTGQAVYAPRYGKWVLCEVVTIDGQEVLVRATAAAMREAFGTLTVPDGWSWWVTTDQIEPTTRIGNVEDARAMAYVEHVARIQTAFRVSMAGQAASFAAAHESDVVDFREAVIDNVEHEKARDIIEQFNRTANVQAMLPTREYDVQWEEMHTVSVTRSTRVIAADEHDAKAKASEWMDNHEATSIEVCDAVRAGYSEYQDVIDDDEWVVDEL